MPDTDLSTEAQFAQVWRANHSHLVNLAFGMLGNIGAAEDAVQEAFSRLAKVTFDQIDDARGWLIVVTSRICLDQVRSAHSRREQAHDSSTIELAGTQNSDRIGPDPADRVTLDDEVRTALLIVLQRLTPIERVVFVLHDIFQMPFETIAETVGRPAPTCRQLARRARLKLDAQASRPSIEVDAAEHRLVAEEFIRACSGGDLAGLLHILDPEVSGQVDLGPSDPRSGLVNHGAPLVARNLLHFFRGATLVSNPVGGHTIVLSFVRHRLNAIILLTVEDRVVQKIHVLADVSKLDQLNSQLSATSSVGEAS
jgi:RNA polymerase sigma-70 factor (ECF subfamily)